MIKVYECKLCKFRGIRKNTRTHIKENHLWRGKALSEQIRSYEIDEEGKELKVKVKKWKW